MARAAAQSGIRFARDYPKPIEPGENERRMNPRSAPQREIARGGGKLDEPLTPKKLEHGHAASLARWIVLTGSWR